MSNQKTTWSTVTGASTASEGGGRSVKAYRLGKPPASLRRAKLDNLALMPGNLLPFKEQYQQIANNLPAGEVLVILPSHNTPSSRILATVTSLLEAKGHHVTTLPADRLARSRSTLGELRLLRDSNVRTP